MSDERGHTVSDELQRRAILKLQQGDEALALQVQESQREDRRLVLEDARYRHRLAVEADQLERKMFREAEVSMFDTVISYGTLTVRSLLILNGGAAIALLALLGHVVTSDEGASALLTSDLAKAIRQFGMGALCGAGMAALGYFTQYAYTKEMRDAWWGPQARGLHFLTVALGLIGYGFFISGLLTAARAFG